MAVPSNPTVAQIVTEGLKRGGRTTPTSTEITDATTHQFREVKADIQRFAVRHPLLKTSTASAIVVGNSRYTQPTDADVIESIVLLHPATSNGWYATAQAGGSNFIRLTATFNESDTTKVAGKFIVLVAGTGATDYRQIIRFNNSTKYATVNSAWSGPNPDSTSVHLIAQDHYVLWNEDKQTDWDFRQVPGQQGTPKHASQVGLDWYLDYAPENVYALLWTYWVNLDRLDDTGSLFVRLLREWRSLWINGIAAYTMQRYDDERFGQQMQIYQAQLNGLGADASRIGQVQYRDV